jgi:hypothetical protein
MTKQTPQADTILAIRLTKAENQSGYNRVKFAEGLIEQLPTDHDGRNTWLLNFGVSPSSRKRRKNYHKEHGRLIPEPSQAEEIGFAISPTPVQLSETDWLLALDKAGHYRYYGEGEGSSYPIKYLTTTDAARVACLLSSPPPAVDPDAGAKDVCWAWHKYFRPDVTRDGAWAMSGPKEHPGWRAAAAAQEKSNG